MRYYPINLDIQGRRCIVVGGGSVGQRKVKTLLECGATVEVISPAVTAMLKQLAQQGHITLQLRAYQTGDLNGAFLVIGATDDEPLNQRISQDARQHSVLCNIADRPEVCNFILPAIVRRGDLTIAISTAGNSPAFAKRLRLQLEQQFGDEYTRFLQLMGAIRQKLLSQAHEPEAHKPLFERLIDGGLLDMIKIQDTRAIDALLSEVLGPQFTYQGLMSSTP